MKKSELTRDQLEFEVERLKQDVASCEAYIEQIRALEEKHAQSQVRFKTIFERSQLGKKILGPDLSILEVNDAFIALLGYSDKKDIINRKVIEFAHPNFINHWHELQLKLWEERIPNFSLDTCLVRKDKTLVWCHVSSILFQDGDRTLGYTVLENITERKIIEDKAKRLYEAQELVMNAVAHDLKSPLNTIQSLSGIIRNNIEKEEKDKALLHLSLLDKTCSRNDVIINDLLLIGELELDTEALQRKTVDVVEIVKSVVEQLSAGAHKKEVQVVEEYLQPVVFAHVDREKLSRVVENLLSNAIKFTESSGKVIISVQEEGRRMLLQVIDHGIGIPEAIQASVFNKFTKAKRKGTQGEQTTGLGLFIAKRIVEMHEGKIWFDSVEKTVS